MKNLNSFRQETIKTLEDKLRSRHHVLLSEFNYRHNGDHEADLLVINYNKSYAYAYDVKTTNHYKGRKKAIWQLEADEAFLRDRFKIDKVFKFYVHKSNRSKTRNGKLYEIHYIK